MTEKVDAAAAVKGNGGDSTRTSRDITPVLSRRLRAARRDRGLSLAAVAEKAQISTSLLSQIEHGKASPSLVSLVAISDALMLRPGDLLDESPEHAVSPVVRQSERHVIDNSGCRFEYMMHLDDPMLEVAELLLRPGTATRPHLASHTGRDYGVVLEGTVTVEFDSGTEVLEEGDYVAFDADAPHRVVNETKQDARVIWIIAHDKSTDPKARAARLAKRRKGERA